jgi:4-hydroxy-3-polyprenylbenzoate decarboxylase
MKGIASSQVEMIGIGCLIARHTRSRLRCRVGVIGRDRCKEHGREGNNTAPRRLIVGISGACGVVHGLRVLQLLRDSGVETHLVMSKTAEPTFAYETKVKIAEVKAAAHATYSIDDMAASIASGEFRTAGMIVAPCSIRSMSEIATGVTSTLLTRAADVTLKERRRLVLMVRETPLHGGHLRSMAALSDVGAIIAPPVPAFYAKPASIEEMVDHTVGRMLDLFEIDVGVVRRWGEDQDLRGRPVKS